MAAVCRCDERLAERNRSECFCGFCCRRDRSGCVCKAVSYLLITVVIDLIRASAFLRCLGRYKVPLY